MTGHTHIYGVTLMSSFPDLGTGDGRVVSDHLNYHSFERII